MFGRRINKRYFCEKTPTPKTHKRLLCVNPWWFDSEIYFEPFNHIAMTSFTVEIRIYRHVQIRLFWTCIGMMHLKSTPTKLILHRRLTWSEMSGLRPKFRDTCRGQLTRFASISLRKEQGIKKLQFSNYNRKMSLFWEQYCLRILRILVIFTTISRLDGPLGACFVSVTKTLILRVLIPEPIYKRGSSLLILSQYTM